MSKQYHMLQISHELYDKLNKAAVRETVKRSKPITWSKLAKQVLENYCDRKCS